jgi:hypothetical protein
MDDKTTFDILQSYSVVLVAFSDSPQKPLFRLAPDCFSAYQPPNAFTLQQRLINSATKNIAPYQIASHCLSLNYSMCVNAPALTAPLPLAIE